MIYEMVWVHIGSEYCGQHERPLELNDLIIWTECQQWDEELLGLTERRQASD